MTPDERMAAAREALVGCSGWPEGRCQSGKRMFRNRKEANAGKRHHEARIGIQKQNVKLEAYHCKECDWWHLTTREMV